MDKDVGDEELVPLDEDMPEDLQELSPSCICECSRSVCTASTTARCSSSYPAETFRMYQRCIRGQRQVAQSSKQKACGQMW